MTRTAIRHTLSALAVFALVSAFAGDSAWAETYHQSGKNLMNSNAGSSNAMRRKVEEGFNRSAEINAQATIQSAKEASE